MALISTDELRLHTETDLSDEALQRILDANEKEIIRKFGDHTSQVDWAEPLQRSDHIFLSRPVDTVTEVIEYIGEDTTTLAADDYQLVAQWRRVNRLRGGTNGRSFWGDKVKITYTPTDENDERKLVIVDLCKLELEYSGNDADSVGDVKTTRKAIRKERSSIMDRLAFRRLV